MWAALRDRRLQGYKFRRQHPPGPFVVDFVSIAHRMVIEADGGQLADSADECGAPHALTSRRVAMGG